MRSVRRNSWRRGVGLSIFAGFFCSAMAATAPVELGQAEGRLQLSQITALLAGVYDNDPQRFYLEGMKRGKTAPPRLHLEIRKSAQLPNGFDLEERDGSEHAPIVRSGALTLENDAKTRQVTMRLQVTMPVTGDSARCEWRWRKHLSSWLAEPVGDCADAVSAGLAGKILWLADDALWLQSVGGAAAAAAAAGMVDTAELGRANMHECFVAVQARGGEPQIFMGLKTHDRGGTLDIVTKEKIPRKFNLTLRRGMWPSNSGNNLLELMTLTAREEGQPVQASSGWATPDSPRVGFGNEEELESGRSINARCKRAL